jgi:hypothetical protein
VEEFLQKRLLAACCGLFCHFVIFYSNLWRFEGGIFEAHGRILVTGDIACVHKCGFVFSDITFVT